MKKSLFTLLTSAILLGNTALAHNLKLEQPLPQVSVSDEGEIVLKGKESAVIVLDKSGKVKFVKEGKLSNEEIQTVIGLVKNLVQ